MAGLAWIAGLAGLARRIIISVNSCNWWQKRKKQNKKTDDFAK